MTTRRAKLQAFLDGYSNPAQRLRTFTAQGGSGIENFLNEVTAELEGVTYDSNAEQKVEQVKPLIDEAHDILNS